MAASPFSPHETAQLAAALASLMDSGFPLEPGVEAAAAELPRGRSRAALAHLAKKLQGGTPLDAAIEGQGDRFPRHLRVLLFAGVRTAEFGRVLEEFVDLQRHSTAVRRHMWVSLAYPAVLLGLLGLVFLFFTVAVVPGMGALFREFEVELPLQSELLLGLSGPGLWILLADLGVIAAACLLLWLFSGTPDVRRLLNAVPLLGPISRWNALAYFARLLALLVDYSIPLPAAMEIAGEASPDADLAAASQTAAGRIRQGRSLAESMENLSAFPRSLRPVISWGQQAAALPAALRAAAEMFEAQVEGHLSLLRWLVPPLTFLLVLAVSLFLISSMLLPLVSLMERLGL